MKHKRTYRSSINQVAAIDENKVKHLGRNFASIDFEIKEHVNPNEFKYSKMKPVIGKIMICGKGFDVTYSELNQLMRTCNAAMDTAEKAYRLGKWGPAQTR